MLQVRNAVEGDFAQIMRIYHYAQDLMARSGNATQWGHTYPDEELIHSDIAHSCCKVIFDEQGIHGVFALCEGEDPTYQHIEEGKWLNEEPYVTIHRIAGDGKAHGLFQCAVSYCKGLSRNVRVDTHADNHTMQKLIAAEGFAYCGVIHVKDGTARLAYHWTDSKIGRTDPANS